LEIAKTAKILSERNANSLPLQRNSKKQLISLGYDVNDHAYSKSKSI